MRPDAIKQDSVVFKSNSYDCSETLLISQQCYKCKRFLYIKAIFLYHCMFCVCSASQLVHAKRTQQAAIKNCSHIITSNRVFIHGNVHVTGE